MIVDFRKSLVGSAGRVHLQDCDFGIRSARWLPPCADAAPLAPCRCSLRCSELFGEIGALKSATLATKPDGSSKGFAIVTYKRKVDAESALERYNGVPLDGKVASCSLGPSLADWG